MTLKLNDTNEEIYLGIMVTNNLNRSLQCSKAASRARSILEWIARNFRSGNKEKLQILYNTYVRPGLHILRKGTKKSDKIGTWCEKQEL